MRKTVGYDGNTNSGKDEWLTPEWIVRALGPFDLDPCAPKIRPWHTAYMHYSERGLQQHWFGKVWCNPPYNNTGAWFNQCAEHGNAIGLCFNRTETEWFDESIWEKADGLLFKKGRINFYNVDGTPGKSSSGAGSVFPAYGKENARLLRHVSDMKIIEGKFYWNK